MTTDGEVTGLLADLKKAPPAGLILCGHTLRTWDYWAEWKPFRAIVDGRGDIPTVVFFNLPITVSTLDPAV